MICSMCCAAWRQANGVVRRPRNICCCGHIGPAAGAADLTLSAVTTASQGLKGLQAVVGQAAPAYEEARDAVWQAAATAGGPAPPPPIANSGLAPWLRAEVGRTMDGVKQARPSFSFLSAAEGRRPSATFSSLGLLVLELHPLPITSPPLMHVGSTTDANTSGVMLAHRPWRVRGGSGLQRSGLQRGALRPPPWLPPPPRCSVLRGSSP